MFKAIVVGADGSPTAAEAVRQATELAKTFNAALHLVSAHKPAAMSAPGLPREMAGALRPDSQVEALLADLASRARIAGVTVSCHARRSDPAEAIIEVATEVSADLIVVGNKGMKGVRRVLGSVPNSVTHQAPCSTLIIQTT